MRISTIQAFNNGVSGLQRNYADVTRTQEQISTGNRILTPADDPVASVRLLQLEQQQSVLGQYNENLAAANSSLTQEEVTLNSVNTVLQRVRELTVQAGNGALSQEDRKSIAAELGEREEELFALVIVYRYTWSPKLTAVPRPPVPLAGSRFVVLVRDTNKNM